MKTGNEINRIMAERVMKFKNLGKFTLLGWRPYSNPEQAMMCLEKSMAYKIKKSAVHYHVEIGMIEHIGKHSQPLSEVICLAIMKALGEDV